MKRTCEGATWKGAGIIADPRNDSFALNCLTGPLLRQAPVRREKLLHDFALHAVRETSAGARQEAGNLPIDLAPALGLERVGQTESQSLELGADARCDWRCATAAWAEISDVRNAGHWTNLATLTVAPYEILIRFGPTPATLARM
jgi:hypothetical protein